MPRLGPIKRKDLIRYLKILGFEGPHPGGQHQYPVKGSLKLTIPNPHKSDLSRDFLDRILRQAGIEKDEWERL